MAPTRRPAKRKLTRMDAALDAMSPYGFPKKLVRRTVDQLLKVYGGNEGWVFVEDSAYTLLVDTLLEKQSTPSPQDGLIGDGPSDVSPAGCSNSTETSDHAPLTNQAISTLSGASETGNQLPIKAVETVSATTETGNELPIKPLDIASAATEPGNQLSIKVADTISATGETGNQVPVKAKDTVLSDCQPAGKLASGEIHGISTAQSSPETKSSQPVGKLCHQRRRPCHGWISDDDDEDDEGELIELPPAIW
ncbi:uncharacterized protein LOC133294748 isoform X2 [Gastrolobium bilobum]|uniref:uncharacterized protein LOC133294748 isoform X2 n=1 Tax=Gastrolobium bilobum TaxID=150636 RepID=UPI002AAF63E1|nr:uncharacterized protein LOC133294748 isoform X2 [Gastrolobium bilobum]